MGVRRGVAKRSAEPRIKDAKKRELAGGAVRDSFRDGGARDSNHREVGSRDFGHRIGAGHKEQGATGSSTQAAAEKSTLPRVLLLNATHEPLAVVTSRRALVLILAGKAVSIEDREIGAVHSARLVIQVPAVVRLNRYVRVPYRAPTSVTRAGILRRDNKSCAYCAAKGETIDHVIPRSRGGKHSWENCVACCSRCNTRKADRTLDELGWQLLVVPGPPKRTSGGHVWMVDDADPAWAPWLAAGTAA